MEYLYAQINDENICIGISQLAGEVQTDNMIRITQDEYKPDLLGMRYNDGLWESVETECYPST